jgi:hypothetical protein
MQSLQFFNSSTLAVARFLLLASRIDVAQRAEDALLLFAFLTNKQVGHHIRVRKTNMTREEEGITTFRRCFSRIVVEPFDYKPL